MPTRVRFRLNKITGEVEEFLIDDQDRNLSEAEHDRIATEVGQVIARRPQVSPVDPASEQRSPDTHSESNRHDPETETATPEQPQRTNRR